MSLEDLLKRGRIDRWKQHLSIGEVEQVCFQNDRLEWVVFSLKNAPYVIQADYKKPNSYRGFYKARPGLEFRASDGDALLRIFWAINKNSPDLSKAEPY